MPHLRKSLSLCHTAILVAVAVTGCLHLSAQQNAASTSPTASLPDAPSPQQASQTTQETDSQEQNAVNPFPLVAAVVDPGISRAENGFSGYGQSMASSSSVATNVSHNAPDEASDDVNQANNPITLKTQILVQNFFMPAPQGEQGRSADESLIRLYLPFKVFGVDNITRIYQPIDTDPLFPSGREAGLGDTTIYDLALHKLNKFTAGAGPLLVLPVASHTNEGDGKWQAGGAAVAVTTGSWGIAGTVVTYQHSFAGDGSQRPTAELVTVQPKIYYNLPHRLYLRSSGIWSLNFDAPHVSEIPLGFGIGKVKKLSNGTIMNFYIEPQYSVYQHGPGSPTWQILSGVSILFPNKSEKEEISSAH